MDNEQHKAEIMMPLSPKEVQARIRGLIEFVHSDVELTFVSKDTGRPTTLKEDLELLELTVKYEVFDKEASMRQSFESGRRAGRIEDNGD